MSWQDAIQDGQIRTAVPLMVIGGSGYSLGVAMNRVISNLVHCMLDTACSVDPCGCDAVPDAVMSIAAYRAAAAAQPTV